jgi:hypothetical protein
MLRNLDGLQPGDVLSYWHDTGAFGAHLAYARILRLGKVRLRVVGEHGEESWKDPHFFHEKVDAKTVAELRAEGVNI